jgi:hypothetical protein
MRWFSLIYREIPGAGAPILTHQAFSRLRGMDKHSGW